MWLLVGPEVRGAGQLLVEEYVGVMDELQEPCTGRVSRLSSRGCRAIAAIWRLCKISMIPLFPEGRLHKVQKRRIGLKQLLISRTVRSNRHTYTELRGTLLG